MNDMPDHGGHSHPQTFDEVIARGFPREALLAPPHAVPRRAAARLPQAAEIVATRKDQAALSATEQDAFRNAVTRLVQDGKYLQLIRDHMDMSHNMHGNMGETGLYRFLAWHRRYLVAFEQELQRIDAILRPTEMVRVAIPYWRWQDPFPVWLDNFLPANDPVSGQAPPPRRMSPPHRKPTAVDVDLIVNQFRNQETGLPNENDYTKFTWALEGWGKRPDGTDLRAHNHGHSWIGGIMNNTSTSPTDPMFWLHHAEIDRLWQILRQTNADTAPQLSGTNLIMDPWAESYTGLLDIAALGYAYDSMSVP